MLVEIFMHLFAGVEPQQLLDAPRLLAQQQVRAAAWRGLACHYLVGRAAAARRAPAALLAQQLLGSASAMKHAASAT